MLRANQKRKRTHQEVVAEKAEEDEKWLRMNDTLQKMQKLEDANEHLLSQVKEHEGASFILQDLQTKGKLQVDDLGAVYIPGIDVIPEESSLKSKRHQS